MFVLIRSDAVNLRTNTVIYSSVALRLVEYVYVCMCILRQLPPRLWFQMCKMVIFVSGIFVKYITGKLINNNLILFFPS